MYSCKATIKTCRTYSCIMKLHPFRHKGQNNIGGKYTQTTKQSYVGSKLNIYIYCGRRRLSQFQTRSLDLEILFPFSDSHQSTPGSLTIQL